MIAPAGSRLVFDAIQAALVLLLVPPSSRELFRLGGVTGRWTMSILPAVWQVEHSESSACDLPPWAKPPKLVVAFSPLAASAMVTPMPVAKLMPSWQAPQARRLGTFFQLSPCAVLAVEVLEPSWHLVQLRRSCGNATSLYGTPA